MAGKSYIKVGSSWSKIRRMYVKTGPVWTSVRKAYIKTGNVWKKMFDSSSRIPYTTETPTIRHDAYTGTVVSGAVIQYPDPTGESVIGIKLWGRENPSSWGNGPFTQTKYQWYAADNKQGTNAYIIKDSSDTYYVGSSENNDQYDGKYLFFRALYTNAYGTGVANSLPVYVHKNEPYKITGAGGGTTGISSTATEVGTPIQFDFYWNNAYTRSIDRYYSTIEWYRGSPLSDKSNLVQVHNMYQANWIVENTTEFSGNDTYTPSSSDLGYTIYVVMTGNNTYTMDPIKTALYTVPIVSTYYTATVVSSKPVINSPVTITKVDGYQTINYQLKANTQTYTPSASTVYWGWQWASSATASNSSWRGLQTRSYSPIYGGYQTTNYFGSEPNQGVDHYLYIPSTVYDGSTDVSTVGKYFRFYSIGSANGAQSITNNSAVLGPIYNYPTTPGNPSISFYAPYSSSQAYIRAFWNPSTYSLDYTLQYKSGGTWYDALTVTDAPQYVSTDGVLVPTGTLIFRVRARNAENIYQYSSEITFNVPASYSFSFGNYLYPNTNGQIGLDNGTTSTTPSGGRLIAVYPLDLAETTTGYYSDGRYYYIQFSGYQYQNVGVATYALRYQVKFDSLNPGYADILICNKGSSLPLTTVSPGLYNGSTQTSGLPGPYVISTNTTYRIYMDGTAGSFGQTQAQIPSVNFITHTRDFGSADDGYHSLLTAKNQYITSMLSVNSATVDSTGIHVSFSGLNGYSYYGYELRSGSYYGSLFSSGGSQTANPLNIGSLTGGTTYYLTITPYNTLGQPGDVYQNSFLAPNNPQPFTTISGSKGFPSGAVQSASEPSGNRTLTVSWNASSSGPNYEVQYEGSNNNSTWTILQSLNQSSYKTATSDTYTAAYYRYYRYSVRARGSDYALANAAYSDGGTSTNLIYRNIDGTNPSAPNIGIITPGTGSSYNTASIAFTTTSSPGSNTINWNQYSLDNTNWTNIYTGPIGLTGLSASTGYYIYMRSWNYDDLYSGSTYQYFTTNAAPAYLTAPTPSSVSKSGANFNIYFSGGSGPYYQTYWSSSDSVPTATGYDANGSSSPISVTNLVSPVGGTTYYFSVRSVSALTNTGTGTTTSLTISPWSSTRVSYYAPIIPTITMSANSGVGQTSATINWTSTNQSYAYVDSTYVGNVKTYTFSNLSASTSYNGTVTVYSTDSQTASASYSFTTTAVPSYTITYNGNGNTGGSTTATTGSGSVTLRSNGFTRTNATFAGWNTNSSGTGTNYSAGGTYTLNADVTLYAKWTANTVTFTNPTVSFNGTTGSGTNTIRYWSWTTGSVSGATATGYQWAISSTSSTTGFGSFSSTTTATSLQVNASSARWLKVRKVATDGLGTEVYSGTNNGV